MSDFQIKALEESQKPCNPCMVIEPDSMTSDALRVRPELRIHYDSKSSPNAGADFAITPDQDISFKANIATISFLGDMKAHDFFQALEDPEGRKGIETKLTQDINDMLKGVSIDGVDFGEVKFPKEFLAQEAKLKEATSALEQARVAAEKAKRHIDDLMRAELQKLPEAEEKP